MLKRLKEKISQFSRQGLFHIFGSSVFAKVDFPLLDGPLSKITCSFILR